MTNWTPATPLSDEPQDQAYWEPWTPKIGQRVRVRLSGECNVDWSLLGPNKMARHGRRGHFPEEQGRTGTIKPCGATVPCTHTSAVGHGYQVVYDEGFEVPDMAYRPNGGHYAACELEALE